MKLFNKLIFKDLVFVIAIWIVGYIIINVTQKTLHENIGEKSISLAQEIMNNIDKSIHSRIEIFEEYANDLILRTAILKSNQRFAQLDNIEEYINIKDKEWTSVPEKTITPFMQEILNGKLSKELKEKIEYYEEKYGYRVYAEVFVTNKYGANIAQTRKTSDYKQDDEEWWNTAKKDGLYVKDVAYDKCAKMFSVNIGIRVDDEDGNFQGIIKVMLNAEEIFNTITLLNKDVIGDKNESWTCMLSTKDGKLIYKPGEFELLENVYDSIKDPIHSKKGCLVSLKNDENNKPVKVLCSYAASKGYKDYKGLGWIFVIEQNTKEIFGPVRKIRNIMFFILLSVTFCSLFISSLISRSISEPVKNLKNYTIDIGKGNYDKTIDIKSKDEVGELASSFNKMTKELSVRTKQLSTVQNDLVRKEKLAFLGQLAGGVGHELRNPLGIISNAIYFLKMTNSDNNETTKEYLEIIEDEVKNSESIVTDLLDFSLTKPAKKEQITVSEIIANAVKKTSIPGHVRVSTSIDSDLEPAYVDARQIYLVMNNLITNACQAMPDGGQLSIKAVKDNNLAIVSVEDTGCGISEEERGKIFEPLFTTKARGIGLGLSVTQAMLKANDATLEVKSEKGKGSVFTVRLPIKGD